MKRVILTLAALFLFLGGVGPAKANPVVPNSGFETPNLHGGYQYDPSGASWTFGPPAGRGGEGIAANGSAFNVVGAAGNQAGFLQGTGMISQAVSGFSQGTYTLSFLAEGRATQQGANPLEVTLDGTPLLFGGSTTITPPAGSTFVSYTSAPFTVTAGTHTLAFLGLNATQSPTNDKTSFIDQVSFAPLVTTPEPASLTLLGGIGVLGALGYGWRRRKQAKA